MSVSQGAKQYLSLILVLLGLSSNGLWAMFAWSYSGLAADVKTLNNSVPRLEDRQAYMVKAAEVDKGMLVTLSHIVANQDKNAALVEQRLGAIEEQLKAIKGFLDFHVRQKP